MYLDIVIFEKKEFEVKINLIRLPELRKRLGGENAPSAVTIWRWERAGQFPKRKKIGPNTVAWIVEEVDAWMAQFAGEKAISTSEPILNGKSRE